MRLARLSLIGTLALALLAPGCRTLRGPQEPGQILVGSPKVVTRERLVNDRLKQVEWLNEQLTAPNDESFTSFQGASDVSTFVGTSFGVGVNANPLEIAAYRQESDNYVEDLKRKEELAALDHEIELARRRQALENVSGEPAAGESTTERPEPPSSSAPDVSEFVTRLTQTGRSDLLPSAKDLELAAKVDSSPVDLFRDRLAYREEIRNEILETGLDDRHDLKGNTLYRLTFDATLVPSEGVADWAAIDVQLSNAGGDADLDRWLETFERDLQSQFFAHLQQLEACAVPEGEKSCALPEHLRLQLLARSSVSCPQMTQLKIEPYSDNNILALRMALPQIPRDLQMAALQTLLNCIGSKEKRRSELFKVFKTEEIEQGELDQLVDLVDTDGEISLSFKNCQKKCAGFQTALGKSSIYAYSVTPKESVQRISELEGHRRALEIAASLGLLAGKASLQATLDFIRESQELVQGIRRQPLVVGYTGNADNVGQSQIDTSSLKFGWLIGPKFDPKGKNPPPLFSHTPIQNGLSALIAVPAWWTKLKVEITPQWVDPKLAATRRKNVAPIHYEADLPGDVLTISDALRPNRLPRVLEDRHYRLVKDQPATLLIAGTDLWRGTVVTVGSQTTEKVQVLSDMRGIVARFDAITEPIGKDIPVQVWTSTGRVTAGTATITKRPAGELGISLTNQSLIAGKTVLKLKITSGELPSGFDHVAQLGLRKNGAVDAAFEWFTPSIDSETITLTTPKLERVGDGDKAQITLQITNKKAPGPSDVHVTADTVAIYYSDPDKAKVAVPGNAAPGEALKITLPKNAAAAFPGAGLTTVVVKVDGQATNLATKKDAETYEVKVPEKKDLGDAKKLIVALEPPVPGLELANTSITIK